LQCAKYEEAEELKGCRPEVHDNVAIYHQREDSGCSAMGFPLFCEIKKTLHRSNDFEESSSSKKGRLFFSYVRFLEVQLNFSIGGATLRLIVGTVPGVLATFPHVQVVVQCMLP
jgi:hypothetical protein